MSFVEYIANSSVILKTKQEVVQFSFIVRNSISYLDLELGPWERVGGINTEEKCRKFFAPRRKLFYTLHLDYSEQREHGLRNAPILDSSQAYTTSPFVSKIEVDSEFDRILLNDIIDYALSINFSKQIILKCVFEVRCFGLLKTKTKNKFIDCFYPKITNSSLFKDFILQFDIINFMIHKEQPDILEHLLYHARLYGRRDLDEGKSIDEEIISCIIFRSYANIAAALKYMESPRFISCDYEELLRKIGSFTSESLDLWKGFEKLERCVKKERITHILLIIWMYNDSKDYIEAASEALRLIWCSVKDAFITYEEIKMGFEAVFSEEKLLDIYSFYMKSVGESKEDEKSSNSNIRSLKHLCRTVIRRILRENQFWIPEGIERTGLPKPLQSFLNLEKEK